MGIERVGTIVAAMKELRTSRIGCPGVIRYQSRDSIPSGSGRNSKWRDVANVELALDQSLPSVDCIIGELNQVILEFACQCRGRCWRV